MQTSNRSTPVIVGSLAIAAIIGASVYVFETSTSSSTATAPTTSLVSTQSTPGSSTTNENTSGTSSGLTTSPATSPSNQQGNSSTSSYKDGTYSATANYSVPHGGQNSIKVTITIKDGSVASVKTAHDYADRESGMYIDSFDSSIESVVVGKALSSTYTGRVGGASLTSSAFDQALQTIRQDANA